MTWNGEAWNGKIPLLGFDGERHVAPDNSVLHIPVPHSLGLIEVYAWHRNNPDGEGYNVFIPGKNCVHVATPLEAQFIIHNYLTFGGNDQ